MSFKVIEVRAANIQGPRYVAHIAGPGFCLLEGGDCKDEARILKFNESCVFDKKSMGGIIDQQARKGYFTKVIDLPEGFK